LVLLLALQQDALVFPGSGRGDRGIGFLPRVRAHELQRQPGVPFRIAIATPDGVATHVALMFCGNGEDLFSGAHVAFEWTGYGAEAIAVEHPGYGTSEGPPSVEALFGAADIALEFARARADELSLPLVAVGTSLGTFCAMHVAATGKCDRLVLRAPPSSLLAAAKVRFWWLPVSWFLKHRFDNLVLAPQIRCRALVIHGDRDRIVPLEQGRLVQETMAGESELLVVKGGGHSDVSFAPDGENGARVRAFLGRQ
ncbi:MAG: alpha/beta hydrolase, partial [Planctomycetota bacterium]